MLRGIIERKEISKESFAAKKDQIKEQALKRFIENDSGSDSTLEKVSIKDNTLKSRGKLLNDYDSIAMERILGKSDLFPISYLQMGTNSGNSICRIQIRDDKGSFIGSGTGFLVSENVLMTNNHVIDSMRTALNSLVEFNYQDDVNFMPCPTCTFRLDPEQFFITDEELDFTLVALKDNPSRNILKISVISISFPEKEKFLRESMFPSSSIQREDRRQLLSGKTGSARFSMTSFTI